jgi:hypothetical protein
MIDDADEVVRAAAGPMVQVEIWQKVLKDAGIPSKVVGTDLTASFGTALPGSVELWVRKGDFDRAEAALRDAEAHRGEEEG